MNVRLALSVVMFLLFFHGVLHAEIRFASINYVLRSYASGQVFDDSVVDWRRNVWDSDTITGSIPSLASYFQDVQSRVDGGGSGSGYASFQTYRLPAPQAGYFITADGSGSGSDSSAGSWSGWGGGTSTITSFFHVIDSTQIRFVRDLNDYYALVTLDKRNTSGQFVQHEFIEFEYIMGYDANGNPIYDRNRDIIFGHTYILEPGEYRLTLDGHGSGYGDDFSGSSNTHPVSVYLLDSKMMMVPENSSLWYCSLALLFAGRMLWKNRVAI